MKAVIFTEGGEGIGFGHITRCLAVARALRSKRFRVALAVNGDKSIRRVLPGTRARIFDWIQSRHQALALLQGAEIAIIDSYLAPRAFYEMVRSNAASAVYMDDFQRLQYPAGIVVNGAIGAERLPYPPRRGLRYLLGTEYLPIRDEFRHVPNKRIRRDIENILISFGGTDSGGLGEKVADFIRARGPFRTTLITPGRWISAGSIKRAMLEADVAISACGQTTYELARCGVPTIGVGMAQNQAQNIRGWTMARFIDFAGWNQDPALLARIWERLQSMSPVRRRELSALGPGCVDGQGARRIVDAAHAGVCP